MGRLGDLESSASESSTEAEYQPTNSRTRRLLLPAFVGLALVICGVEISRGSAGTRRVTASLSAKVGLDAQMATNYETVQVGTSASGTAATQAATAAAAQSEATVQAPSPSEYTWASSPQPSAVADAETVQVATSQPSTVAATAAALQSGAVSSQASAVSSEQLAGQTAAEQAAAAAKMADAEQAKAAPLMPEENKDDNNPCADEEEFHAGLCYDKCAHMTKDQFPFRQSAWTCCSKPVCAPTDFHGISDLVGQNFGCCRHNMGFCSGFDIAGYKEGKKICPHKPGVCLTDEELFLGMCFKKCTLLTNNKYPHRVAAASCCKVADGTCMFQDGANDGFDGKSLTKKEFNVGGGCGDGSKLTNCKPHGPESQLTD